MSFYPLLNRFNVGKRGESLEGGLASKDVSALSFYQLPNRFKVGKDERVLGVVLL